MDSPAQQVQFNDVMSQLQPQILDQSRCTPLTSLTEQLKKAAIQKAAKKRQRKQFNMANGIYFDDPIEAAGYLLEREYGETSIFGKPTDNGPVFIPPSFLSGYHQKENAILDYDIAERLRTMEKNLSRDAPGEWFTVEFQRFVKNATELKYRDIFEWRRKMQLLDLVRNHGPKVDSALIPDTNKSITDIISECAELMNGADEEHELSKKMFTFSEKQVIDTKMWLTNLIKEFPLSSDSWALSWLYDLDDNVSGEKAERWVFDRLQECVTEEDFVVLRGADILFEADKMLHREMDFLIFSAQRKIVICLEVKYSFREKAIKQVKEYYKLLGERFGDIIGDWTFIPFCCFYDESTVPPPYSQAKYVITGSTDMKTWWESICCEYPTSDCDDENAQKQLQDVLKLIVFTFHMAKSGFVTPTKIVGEVSKAIEIVSTASNILFYSKNQLQIMNGNYANVLLKSSYGTGKTFLLFEKAKELARRGEKVTFILQETSDQTLLGKQLQDEARQLEHLTVVQDTRVFDVSRQEYSLRALMGYVQSHPKSHIFVDEWRLTFYSHGVADFESLLHAMKGKHFWLSLSRETSYQLQNNERDDWKDLPKLFNDNFFVPQLEYSMRNSAAIVRAAKALNHENIPVTLPPYNFPHGIAPEKFPIHASEMNDVDAVERVFRTVYDAARQQTDKGILVIVRNYFNPKVLVESAQRVVINEEFYTFFKGNYSGLNFGDHERFLREKMGVLICDARACRGIEFDCVICFCGDANPRAEPSESLCNWFMRCKSFLFVIKCEEEANVLDLPKKRKASFCEPPPLTPRPGLKKTPEISGKNRMIFSG